MIAWMKRTNPAPFSFWISGCAFASSAYQFLDGRWVMGSILLVLSLVNGGLGLMAWRRSEVAS